jgi:RNA polymerase sigma-70 factor, ECF subfamily
MHLSEQQLRDELKIVEAAKAQPEKFGLLYEKYYKQIFQFVYKRTDDEDVAADITAQVFIKAMLNLPKYQYKGVPFSAWLYRIAGNEVNQHFRTNKGERTVSIERNEMSKVLRIAEEGEDGFSDEDVAILMETIQEMEPDEVQILELRFFEDRPFKEVAYIMGITENNAKVKVYRIIERLKKKMQKKMVGR